MRKLSSLIAVVYVLLAAHLVFCGSDDLNRIRQFKHLSRHRVKIRKGDDVASVPKKVMLDVREKKNWIQKDFPEYNVDYIDGTSTYTNNRAVDTLSSIDNVMAYDDTLPNETPINSTNYDTETLLELNEEYENLNNVIISDGVCHSLDIRNDVKSFEVLKNCRVIEGFLHIVLMDKKNATDFENVTFPELREISGYFLIYHVSGLKSIGHLFPNLEIIRGDLLMTDYAFMVYENQNLQELGLTKLTQISRGGVRIEYNPSLCYTTLNWNAIVVAGEVLIKDNRIEGSCPGCPQCTNGHCWTNTHCQEIVKPKCHPMCFGECYGPKESDCFVCKNFRHEGKCVENCPPHLFAYLSRRCITKEECVSLNKLPENIKLDEDKDKQWRPFEKSCISQCPSGFENSGLKNHNLTCRPCTGLCRKENPGAVIRHIADAQKFRGVTVVKGSLEFQMFGASPTTMTELTKEFGLVEEITGHLRITHSFPITSLSFLKKLKIIGGNPLDMRNSSMVIIDNPNLSELFPSSQKIQLQRGKFFFHYNPKLCLWKIQEFSKQVGQTNYTDIEVHPTSNGYKVACNVVGLSITVNETGPTFANISWGSYVPRQGQQLLSYLLNYIETDNENITYESNTCGNITWQVVDIPKNSDSSRSQVVSTRIVGLKPYTKYAAYVKTFSAAKNKFSSPVGQSEIIFFHTKNDKPSEPQDVTSYPVSDSEIIVKWVPPENPNGPIGNYMVAGFLRADNEELPLLRDYCKYDLVEESDIPLYILQATEKASFEDSSSCCSKHNPADKTMTSKTFEIFCHENVTISYLSGGRNSYCISDKYNVEETDFRELVGHITYSPIMAMDKKMHDGATEVLDDRKTRMYNGIYHSFVFNVSSESNEYILTKLKHFSLYTISVAVCSSQLNDSKPMCSTIQYTNSRTNKNPKADEVHNVKTHVHNSTIMVSWDPVKDPNGLTVAYTVEYTNLNVKDARKSTECIPHVLQSHRQSTPIKHYIKNLSPGKYSLRVRSKSLAGDGIYSETVYFTIGLNNDSNSMTITLVLCFIATTIIAVVAYVGYQYRRKKTIQERLIASVNPDYVSTQYVPDMWEVPRDSVELLDELGLGNFGMVYHGLFNESIQVAVKTISESATEYQRNEFLNEASVMKNFSTFHIIRLLGVVSDGNPPLVIMELMENGDLKSYLRRLRDSNLPPDASRLVRMAAEIADGMAYLESKKFVHRDLAARNCMVSKDLVCKIGDFGMARDIYETDYYKIGQKGLLPIRWMAPENLSDGVFTSDSDVWSYGVVLYEIIMLGELPYQGLSNEEVINYVLHKGRLNILVECPEILGKMVEKCFKWRPHERPTFMEIVGEFEPFLGQDFCERSFYHSEEAVALRQLGIKKAYHQPAVIRFNWGNETARWVKEFEDNVYLLDQTKAGTSRGRIFKNGFQQLGNLEEVPLDR